MRSSWHARLGLFLLVVLSGSLVLLVSVRSAAQATSLGIALSPNVGPPTTITKVQGTGFKSSESVSIDFDTRLMALITASTRGSFLVSLPIPRSAHPGYHLIQAMGQTSGRRALAHFLVRTDWAQFGFRPHQTRYNPYENVLTPSNVSALTLDWSYTTGYFIQSSPAIVNGVVYIGSNDGKLYALNAVTGAFKWSYTFGTPAAYTSPAVANGVVYFGADKLYALDAVTGALKWSYSPSNGYFSSPTVSDGVVYVGLQEDYTLYALDAVTGTLKWSDELENSMESSPAVAHGVVYAIATDMLWALDAVTGTPKWSYELGPGYQDFYSPAVVNGVVYVGAYNVAYNGKLYALDAVTGALKWSYSTGAVIFSSPAVANGVVYFDADKLYALDAVTGALKWSYSTGSAISSSPAVANGVVYVGAYNGKLYALDALTGTRKWSYSTGAVIFSSPAVANGVVYVGSYDYKMYAFHLPGMS